MPISELAEPVPATCPPVCDAEPQHRRCYHCGLAASDSATPVELDGATVFFCCTGCRVLAGQLHAAGLGHLYRAGSLFATPLERRARQRAQLAWPAYDTPELMRQYTTLDEHGVAQCVFSVEGVRCAACVWLIEQTLERRDGVLAAEVNYATCRATIRWRPDKQKLSDLMRACADLGYLAWPFEAARSDARARGERRMLLIRLAVAMLSMMQVMMYALPAYTHADSMAQDHALLLRWTSLLLTLPTVLFSAAPIFRGAWRSLRNKTAGMDVPVALGIGAAFAASVIATLRQSGEVYFDSVTMFVAFLLAARYLELRARQSAQSAGEALAGQLPATCTRLRAQADPAHVGQRETIPVAQLAPGDLIEAGAGEVIAADGIVIAGIGEVDESLLTGESRLMPRGVGAAVLAGSINATTPLRIRVTKVGADTRLCTIARLLERALADKPAAVRLADRYGNLYTVVLLALAAAAGLAWWTVDPDRALVIMAAVLVASCPCALSLALPAALAAAQAALARTGLLVMRAHALETLTRVTDVVLDKTGTLTEGRLSLRQVDTYGELDAPACVSLAAALEGNEGHPIAKALRAAADAAGASPCVLADVAIYTAGAGLQGTSPALGTLRLGSHAYVLALAADKPAPAQTDVNLRAGDALPDDAMTHVWLGSQHGMLARFTLCDRLRPDTPAMVQALLRRGLRLHLVSGDDERTVRWWSRQLGILHAAGAVGPEEKRQYVASLQARGRTVLAMGDGINDAPVLAQADVSVAVAAGAALAQAGADILLCHDRNACVAHAIDFSHRTRRVIRQNLAWALVYNLAAIPLAASGLMTPWMAGAGMSLSSLLVVGNAWRLTRRMRAR